MLQQCAHWKHEFELYFYGFNWCVHLRKIKPNCFSWINVIAQNYVMEENESRLFSLIWVIYFIFGLGLWDTLMALSKIDGIVISLCPLKLLKGKSHLNLLDIGTTLQDQLDTRGEKEPTPLLFIQNELIQRNRADFFLKWMQYANVGFYNLFLFVLRKNGYSYAFIQQIVELNFAELNILLRYIIWQKSVAFQSWCTFSKN